MGFVLSNSAKGLFLLPEERRDMGIRKLLLGVSVLAVFAMSASAQQFETDFQVWNETQLIYPLTKKRDWNLALAFTGRFGDTVSRTTDARVGIQLSKKVNKYVTLGGGYLYRYSNPTFVRRRYESRYIATATFTVPLDKKWAIVNRNMVQYEDRYSRRNSTVVRPRIWLRREVTISKKKFEPFVSFEPFYDQSLRAFARYRTQAGISHKFNSTFSADFYYVRQDETGNGTRPGALNGIGTNFRFNLK